MGRTVVRMHACILHACIGLLYLHAYYYYYAQQQQQQQYAYYYYYYTFFTRSRASRKYALLLGKKYRYGPYSSTHACMHRPSIPACILLLLRIVVVVPARILLLLLLLLLCMRPALTYICVRKGHMHSSRTLNFQIRSTKFFLPHSIFLLNKILYTVR